MSETIRVKLSAVAVRVEATAGVDAFGGSTPSAADFIACEATMAFPQQTVADPSVTGSYDSLPPIPTGIRPELTLRIPLRGPGVAGQAPEWGKLMTACRFTEQELATSVGAPGAATAGTANSVTLATPFDATAQAYRGMPIVLSGNPTAPRTSLILDYTSGRVASLPETFNPVLSTATLAQIPRNFLYATTDDESEIQPVTIYGYRDGLRHRFVGVVGSVAVQLQAGQPGFLTFTLRGQLIAAYEAEALPVGWNNKTRPQVPIWANGLSRLDRAVARCAQYGWTAQNTLYDPENPEAPQGFDAPIITAANQQVTIDPFATTSASPGRFGKFQAGTDVSFAALLGSGVGNRVGIINPALRITSYSEAVRGELGVDQLQATPAIPGAGIFLSVW